MTQVKEFFQTKIKPDLNYNKIDLITVAIAEVIKEDKSIKDKAVIDKINSITKGDLISGKPIVDAFSFIAGAFIYALEHTHNKECKDFVENNFTDFINEYEKLITDSKKPSAKTNNIIQAVMRKNEDVTIELGTEIAPSCKTNDINSIADTRKILISVDEKCRKVTINLEFD